MQVGLVVRFVCAVIRVSRRVESPVNCVLVFRLPPVFMNRFWGANFLHPVCMERARARARARASG